MKSQPTGPQHAAVGCRGLGAGRSHALRRRAPLASVSPAGKRSTECLSSTGRCRRACHGQRAPDPRCRRRPRRTSGTGSRRAPPHGRSACQLGTGRVIVASRELRTGSVRSARAVQSHHELPRAATDGVDPEQQDGCRRATSRSRSTRDAWPTLPGNVSPGPRPAVRVTRSSRRPSARRPSRSTCAPTFRNGPVRSRSPNPGADLHGRTRRILATAPGGFYRNDYRSFMTSRLRRRI